MPIRLQKIIAQAGVASRREAERLIAEGAVTVNGVWVTEPGAKADPLADAVKVRGKLITRREPPVYLVMNKPRNVLTTLRDEEAKDRPTVADLLRKSGRRAFPVGRLDFDAEGVLLLTNDGELANRLMHPRYRVPRVYEAKVKGRPDKKALRRLTEGPWLGAAEGRPAPAKVRLLARKTARNAWLRIELREGKHHQVKRMCAAVGHPVVKLVRVSYGGVRARGLPAGGMRPLTAEEIHRLRVRTGLAEGEGAGKRAAPAGPQGGRKGGKPSPKRPPRSRRSAARRR